MMVSCVDSLGWIQAFPTDFVKILDCVATCFDSGNMKSGVGALIGLLGQTFVTEV